MWISGYGFFEFEQSKSISFISKCLYKSGRLEKVHAKKKGYDMKVYRPKCPEVKGLRRSAKVFSE